MPPENPTREAAPKASPEAPKEGVKKEAVDTPAKATEVAEGKRRSADAFASSSKKSTEDFAAGIRGLEEDRFPKIKEELAAAKKILQDPHATADEKFKAFGNLLAGTFELIGRKAERMAGGDPDAVPKTETKAEDAISKTDAKIEISKVPVDAVEDTSKEYNALFKALDAKHVSLEAEYQTQKRSTDIKRREAFLKKQEDFLKEQIAGNKRLKELSEEYMRRKEEVPKDFPENSAIVDVEYANDKKTEGLKMFITFKNKEALSTHKEEIEKNLKDNEANVEDNELVITKLPNGFWKKDATSTRTKLYESLKSFTEPKPGEKPAKKES